MKIKNLSLGIVLALIGLVMLVWPSFCIKIVVIIAGIATVACGIYNLATASQYSNDKTYKKASFIKNILSILVGIVAVLCPLLLMKSFSLIWNVITYTLAIYFVIYAIFGLFLSSYTKDFNPLMRKRITFESMIFLLIAILLFVLPIGAVIETIIRIAGGVALFVGAIVVTREIIYSKNMKSVK